MMSCFWKAVGVFGRELLTRPVSKKQNIKKARSSTEMAARNSNYQYEIELRLGFYISVSFTYQLVACVSLQTSWLATLASWFDITLMSCACRPCSLSTRITKGSLSIQTAKGFLVILNPLKAFVTFISIYTDLNSSLKQKPLIYIW